MAEHRGQLRRAAQRNGRPLGEWLDLSTGVSPFPWTGIAADESAWGGFRKTTTGWDPGP